ncbi:twin-arginine translocase TatA/TatE family subunit [Sphingobacterium oryzagri]|uniref:Sec-independent protein translocase protein TatA n=1 Tax=Sphingobacterium oryzagri TaxID=3025669 RepID=A0ABY7WND6_9SPHI|nr:twin-arginine translocase TatA/TatE family subunit [Sphingobacterium sp. KACC 22765]WDF69820.1 twin-arginine translocase TatA/TatE family subunit [Sphingobacterium sp. KACC 22765]
MTLGFLNIGTQEMILIVIAILLLFGGKKLPELARGLGRGIREFKDASEGIKREISDQINNFDKDLDVTVEDAPRSAVDQTVKSPAEASGAEQSTVTADNQVAQAKPAEEKKPLPKFSAPENTFQHNPGQQPSADEEHYSYGYNDHFAKDADAEVDGATPTDKKLEAGEQTKNA